MDVASDPWQARLHAGDQRQDDELRSTYERDRDRVLYSPAFRRLGGIAQVAAASEMHLFHNRLTHSLKVGQVGRRLAEYLIRKNFEDDPRIAERLRIYPDIVETAGLAHDLGHPPFGHIAESELDHLIGPQFGTYEGNAQTFRILTKLAIKTRLVLRSHDKDSKAFSSQMGVATLRRRKSIVL